MEEIEVFAHEGSFVDAVVPKKAVYDVVVDAVVPEKAVPVDLVGKTLEVLVIDDSKENNDILEEMQVDIPTNHVSVIHQAGSLSTQVKEIVAGKFNFFLYYLYHFHIIINYLLDIVEF